MRQHSPLLPLGQGLSYQVVGVAVQPGVDGRGGGPRPVGEEEGAGVARPPQGQQGFPHLSDTKHFLKKRIAIHSQRLCPARKWRCDTMDRWRQTEPRDTGRLQQTLICTGSTWLILNRIDKDSLSEDNMNNRTNPKAIQ